MQKRVTSEGLYFVFFLEGGVWDWGNWEKSGFGVVADGEMGN